MDRTPSSRPATRANHSPKQERDAEPMTLATCGPTSETLFLGCDRDWLFLKTSADISPKDSIKSSKTLPTSGSMRNGQLSVRPMLGPRIDVNDSSASLTLLPTPTVVDMGNNKTPAEWDDWTARMRARHGNGNGHGPSLNVEAQRMILFPTPTTQDASNNGGPSQHLRNTPPLNAVVNTLFKTPTANLGTNGGSQHPDKRRAGGHGPTLADEVEWDLPGGREHPARGGVDFGKYQPAVDRWAAVNSPPPAPALPDGKQGKYRLNSKFAAWMMGLQNYGLDELGRNPAIKAVGNAVCPPQAEHAVRGLLARIG